MSRITTEKLAKIWASRSSEGMSMPTMVQGYERLQDKQILRISETDAGVVSSGHSPEHACLYSSALKVLISGKSICPSSLPTSVCTHRAQRESAKNWMESHDHFLDLIPEDTFVLPAHNCRFGVKPRLRDLINHQRPYAGYRGGLWNLKLQGSAASTVRTRADSRQTMMALGGATHMSIC